MNQNRSRILIWYRQDLRILDHEPLFTAIEQQAIAIPFYCFDPRHYGETAFGFAKTGKFRAKFLLESVEELRRSFQGLGTELLVRQGLPEEVIVAISTDLGVDAIYFHKEVTSEEIQVEKAVTESLKHTKVKMRSFWGHSLYHPEDLPFRNQDIPEIFTNFRKHLENNSKIRLPLSIPKKLDDWRNETEKWGESESELSLDRKDHIYIGAIPKFIDLKTNHNPNLNMVSPALENSGVLPFSGGEAEALNRLRSYFWEGDHLKSYKQTRNGMLGADYSSKFSAWLANGCISPRTIAQEVRRYENERIANDSTYWLIFELLWRDYFRFIAYKHGDRLFRISGLQGISIPWEKDWQRFSLWQQGETGFPLIDANMKELAITGFMSNRGRQNVASFLTKNLGIDWRMGAEWFESQLIDYDVCSNWGNWNYTAGIGNDARGFRFFNILKQSHDYDSEGKYVKYWLPALKELPPIKVHEPSKLDFEEQKYFGVTLGVDYPHALVDLFESAKANERIYEAAIAGHQIASKSKKPPKPKRR
jgi:deoxyribodipyrimidine photo-lyase